MDFKEFIEQVKNELPGKLPENLNAQVKDVSVEKLQGKSYEGITVSPQDSNIGVSMDMKPFFHQFENGADMDQVMSHIAAVVENGLQHRPDVTVEKLLDYEEMKKTLSVELVGTDTNSDMLANVPHKEMEDIHAVYRQRPYHGDYHQANTSARV